MLRLYDAVPCANVVQHEIAKGTDNLVSKGIGNDAFLGIRLEITSEVSTRNRCQTFRQWLDDGSGFWSDISWLVTHGTAEIVKYLLSPDQGIIYRLAHFTLWQCEVPWS